ncbi:MAG: hypothetical protein AAGF27_06735 [Pseudomonadota bacterium]
MTSPRPIARPVRPSRWGIDFGDIDGNDLIGRGFDILEDRLSARDEQRLLGMELAEDRYRSETTRQDLERDDDFDRLSLRERMDLDRFRLRENIALDRARLNAQSRDDARDDATERQRIKARTQAERMAAAAEKFAAQTARASGERADDRALLTTRAGVFQDAFESRRGDTVISRIMWPLALAVVGIGTVVLVRGAK